MARPASTMQRFQTRRGRRHRAAQGDVTRSAPRGLRLTPSQRSFFGTRADAAQHDSRTRVSSWAVIHVSSDAL